MPPPLPDSVPLHTYCPLNPAASTSPASGHSWKATDAACDEESPVTLRTSPGGWTTSTEVSNTCMTTWSISERTISYASDSPRLAYIRLVEATECIYTISDSEPRSLTDALRRPDAEEWVKAALEGHLTNGTRELAQLPPGRRKVGSR